MRNSLKSKLNRRKRQLIKSVKKNKVLTDELIRMTIKESDKRKVWAFCAGQFSNDFRGNPKYLFIYINKYRKDISAYWLCEDPNTVKLVRKLGFRAYRLGTKQAEEAINKTGVLVSEQVKMQIPEGLENAVYVNLWHGVGGVKNVERSINTGRLVESISKKYIKNNAYFRTYEMYLAPSKFIEDIAIDQLGIDKKNIIRAGYPRCVYPKKYKNFSSFDGDFIKSRGLPKDTKMVAYVPTYRDEKVGDFFTKAIPDIDRLIKVCEENHLLFVFKMHPLLEKEIGFIKSRDKYKDNKWVIFWDNSNDFYEVMDQVDLCIMDFSSMYTDFIALGTKHFIRYVFDWDELHFNFPLGYDETTLGKKCFSFDELIDYLPQYSKDDLSKDIDKIKKLYWEYSKEEDLDNIIESVLEFKPQKYTKGNLYSYDIFDTLISRKVLAPIGIHYYVKEKLENNRQGFSDYFISNYPKLRTNAELNVREYYNRTKIDRDSLKVEIQFTEIFDRLQSLYNITDKQKDILMKLEMEAELENVIPIKERIDEVKKFVAAGEKVVLISDMYLPKDFIKKMLKKADPMLADLELFLSSEYGYQKADKTLFVEVYKIFGKEYDFGKWIHTGDNPKSDNAMPKNMNIETKAVEPIEFNTYENDLVRTIGTYDSYLVAAALARFRDKHRNIKEEFVYSYVSLLFVPYVRWALHHAKEDKDKVVYFISRDGHQLIRIGDVINKKDNLKLDLKYIYASRKTWRIPSFIDHIDIDFWGEGHGNFADVTSFKNLLKALNLNAEEFKEVFPELEAFSTVKKITKEEMLELTEIFSSSKKYEEVLLEKAAKLREASCGYLEQEIDKNKQFSVIEYWGRGYTQENFTRLWDYIVKKDVPTKFYYSRSTLPSDKLNIRYNFTANPEAQQFIESIFACIDYKSITEYKKVDNKWEPVIVKQKCDYSLFRSMEEYLPMFAEDYCNMPFLDKDRIGRNLIDFAISYYTSKPTWSLFTDILAEQEDSVQLYGDVTEYAKSLNVKDIYNIRFNKVKIGDLTKNPTMSLERSSEKVKNKFYDLYLTDDKKHVSVEKKYKRFEINRSKKSRKTLDKYRDKAEAFKSEYRKAVKNNKVKDQILVITTSNSFYYKYSSLIEVLDNIDYDVTYMDIRNKYLVTEMAKSKFIILAEPYYLFSELKVRKESDIIVLGSSAMTYFAKGLITNTPLKNVNLLENYKYQLEVSAIQSPSELVSRINYEIYTTTPDTKFINNGSVITDMYFDEYKKKLARKKVNKLFRKAKNKKVIAYITYNRYRNADSQYIKTINLDQLKNAFKDEYVVLQIHLNNKDVDYISNKYNIRGFAKDVTGKISIRELMLASDIIIGDYDDALLESPLIGVPVIIRKWPSDTVEVNNKTTIKLEENPYGKVIFTTDDLIDEIKDIKNFDYTNQNEFKEKYLKYCDGKSAERLINYLIKK
ncbi:MAG: CDP-glycerol glycerophosphotransferase family protein [Bacilli bacterium]|nr:CDP-glycerol glycerophosphotransferase family protein [Bacilli bacterium]